MTLNDHSICTVLSFNHADNFERKNDSRRKKIIFRVIKSIQLLWKNSACATTRCHIFIDNSLSSVKEISLSAWFKCNQSRTCAEKLLSFGWRTRRSVRTLQTSCRPQNFLLLSRTFPPSRPSPRLLCWWWSAEWTFPWSVRKLQTASVDRQKLRAGRLFLGRSPIWGWSFFLKKITRFQASSTDFLKNSDKLS